MKIGTILTIILAGLAIVFAILWVSSNAAKSKLVQEKDSLRASYEQATQTINEIQSHIDSFEQGISGELLTGKELPKGTTDERKAQLIATITNMKKQIAADKQKIKELEEKLAKSSVQLKGLQDLVNKLKASVADKEKIVAELSNKLGLVQAELEQEKALSKEEIAKREKTISEKEATIAAQERDLNTIYYISGTRKELIDKKIINRTGGILGLGKVSTLQKNADLSKFTEINLKDTDQIRFPMTKGGYSILSNQNAASYRVDKEGKNYVLTVTDKETFRKVKLVVIELL